MNGANLAGRQNKYECNFFHMIVEGCDFKESPEEMSIEHLGTFIHEYIHYLQQITTPFGLSFCHHFIKKYILYRDHINRHDPVELPLRLDKDYSFVDYAELLLGARNGTVNYSKGRVDRVIVNKQNIADAKRSRMAGNIGVVDDELGRTYENGFDFGYTCVIESMAHLIQSLVNPDVLVLNLPIKYRAAQMICREYCPEIAEDIKMLISLCYTALYFDNPGAAFFTMIDYANEHPGENGIEIYKRIMREHSRKYKGEEMPAYRMMHRMIDEFIINLSALLGHDLEYYRGVFENCKREASGGESKLLEIIYNGDISSKESIYELTRFFGIPCIDSKSVEPIVPSFSRAALLETGCLLSMETLVKRFEEKEDRVICSRFDRCEQFPYEERVTSQECRDGCQWQKTENCYFTSGLKHWGWENKRFIERQL